jgi:chemotaxis protein methyltransferase CheR
MIAPDTYRFVSDLLRRHSGLSLGTGKEYLLESRLPAVAEAFGLRTVEALLDALRQQPSAALIKATCDAMTTNETLFFRDSKPFVAFEQQLLPVALRRARAAGRPLRIWCAAASTGQEPYSLAMILASQERLLAGTPVELLATDYSYAALERARAGVYNQFEVQRGLPVQHLIRYFTERPDGFQISEDIRRRVTFEYRNLLDPFPAHWSFDVIFCRNVLIYFDVPTKKDVVERMARHLTPGGALVLGGTESTLGITDAVVRAGNHPAGFLCRPTETHLLAETAAAA